MFVVSPKNKTGARKKNRFSWIIYHRRQAYCRLVKYFWIVARSNAERWLRWFDSLVYCSLSFSWDFLVFFCFSFLPSRLVHGLKNGFFFEGNCIKSAKRNDRTGCKCFNSIFLHSWNGKVEYFGGLLSTGVNRFVTAAENWIPIIQTPLTPHSRSAPNKLSLNEQKTDGTPS